MNVPISFILDGFPVTPSDANNIDLDVANTDKEMLVSLYIGGAGNLTVITGRGKTITFAGLSAGTFIPGAFRRVKATGTTATLILGLVN